MGAGGRAMQEQRSGVPRDPRIQCYKDPSYRRDDIINYDCEQKTG